jgi:hypothetical protein
MPARSSVHVLIAPVLALSLAASACGAQAPDPGGPEAVVQDAIGRVAAKDIEGLRALACAGQEDLILDQLSIGGLVGGAELIQGLDLQALLDAVAVNVDDVEVGKAVTDAETAQVPVEGSLKVTFDAEAMRPFLRQLLEGQGTSMTDEQLDGLLTTLESYGQDVPLDESVRLVRENGAWKICQDTLEAPAAS